GAASSGLVLASWLGAEPPSYQNTRGGPRRQSGKYPLGNCRETPDDTSGTCPYATRPRAVRRQPSRRPSLLRLVSVLGGAFARPRRLRACAGSPFLPFFLTWGYLMHNQQLPMREDTPILVTAGILTKGDHVLICQR